MIRVAQARPIKFETRAKKTNIYFQNKKGNTLLVVDTYHINRFQFAYAKLSLLFWKFSLELPGPGLCVKFHTAGVNLATLPYDQEVQLHFLSSIRQILIRKSLTKSLLILHAGLNFRFLNMQHCRLG